MNTQNNSMEEYVAPSKAKLTKAVGIALAAAIVILVTAVLPAEYGIDPLKTGKAFGLVGLAQAAATPRPSEEPKPSTAQTPPGTNTSTSATYTSEKAGYKVDSRDINLGPHEGIEIKYRMTKGNAMLYSWKSSSNVWYEFHGEPEGAPKDYFDSYEKDDRVGKQQSNGAFTAPTTGIHGWFWENPGNHDLVIHLTTAGFYEYAKEFRDEQQVLHELKEAK